MLLSVTVIFENKLMESRAAWLIVAAAALAQVIVGVRWPPLSVGSAAWRPAVSG
jgi:hypothetical protein